MSLIIKYCRVAVLLTFAVMLPAALGFAAPAIMPPGEIQAGMHGIARTVVAGTQIEEFGIEVLGVMKNKGPSGDLILVRTYGDLIERTGGIAQGMSGSPVYIDGRLVGAIAYGWSFADHRIGMVTPIGDMLKLWDLPDNLPEPTAGQEARELPKFPQGTALMASGFGEKTLGYLATELKPFNLVPFAVGEAPDGAVFGPLEPGSAVGVQLVRGDVSLGALGTVTYVEGDKVLAFGHPFLKKGASGYFLTGAYVFTIVNGIENSFKVGTTGPAMGVVNQDRGAGIAGQMDRFPGIIPLHITVTDNNLGIERSGEAQVIQDEQLSPVLVAASVLNMAEKTSDRIGPGTAKVSFEISARNMPGEVFKRENMFYSPDNGAQLAVSELHELMTVLALNQFQAVDVMDVKVTLAMDSERRTATIQEAKPKKTTARPGEKVDISVKLKPYRGEPVTVTVPFTVPQSQPSGPMMLEIRGGGIVPLTELISKQMADGGEMLKLPTRKQKARTFKELLTKFTQRDRNNDIVVEIVDMSAMNGEFGAPGAKSARAVKPAAMAPEAKTGNGSGEDDTKKAARKTTVSTDYIVESDTQISLTIQAE